MFKTLPANLNILYKGDKRSNVKFTYEKEVKNILNYVIIKNPCMGGVDYKEAGELFTLMLGKLRIAKEMKRIYGDNVEDKFIEWAIIKYRSHNLCSIAEYYGLPVLKLDLFSNFEFKKNKEKLAEALILLNKRLPENEKIWDLDQGYI